MMPSSEERPRSLHHDWPAYVTFINRTNFSVDVVWIDYNGDLIRYWKRLEPGKRYYQNTYVTHPWIAWNSDTLENVVIDNSFVYLPKPWNGERQRTNVYIDRPMLSLLDICVQKVRSLVSTDQVEELEIPIDLFDKLKQRRSVEVRDLMTGGQ
ncbi:unnamed protein product [Lymnaea stagnalis]|uniref:von Hippel-Lindau disease tumour suppressor beta domain-containing protein n=1 Tax=Lymnaea stagnalis TaxID=6523 RepID=A0AAV2I748_LYMST